MKRAILLLIIFSLMTGGLANGQATFLGNAAGANRYLGFNALSILPLPIRNDGNQPIEFSTNLQLRMTLAGDGRFVFNSTLSQADASFNINSLPGSETALRVRSSNSVLNNTGFGLTVDDGTFSNTGARIVINSSPSSYNSGFESAVSGSTRSNLALRGSASGAQGTNSVNIGVQAEAFNAEFPYSNLNLGVRGAACGGRLNIGVYGSNFPLNGNCYLDPNNQEFYAGYFAGKVVENGNEIVPSDENLKTNIASLEGASGILAQLDPKTYSFLTDEFDYMGLPKGSQFGLISQQVQSVLPELVHDVTFPAQINLEGEELSPETSFLGLEYKPFIPILIAAFNEQQAVTATQQATLEALNETILTLQNRITVMENRVDELTTTIRESQSMNEEGGQSGWQQGAMKAGTTLEQNSPNPFDGQTVISFDIPKNAQVKLEISDASGRLLETLQNGRMEAGNHQVRWDAGRYPAGVYYYSLYADTVLLTRKMIKK